MTTWVRLSLVAACTIASFAVPGFAQSNPRGKSHTLHGTVEGIYDSTQTIRVRQKTIEGFSDARSATYRVDDATILKKLQLDDQIVATIYEKDDVLYDIRVARIDDRAR
jgi:hypothetical protein